MAISFPSNPNVNDTFTVDDKTFLWTGDYWRTLSSAVTFPGIIKDADNDTKVEVEQSVDEDTIRFSVAGTEKASLDASGLTVTGDISVTGSYVGLSSDSITDADGDTKIQVEESADEDTIRFDIAGAEKMTLDSSSLTVSDSVSADHFSASGTGANLIPSGTTAERPVSPTAGMIRFNETTGEPEWYSSATSEWVNFRSRTSFQVSYLVVAGGGGGGDSGAGGAGGYRNSYASESSGGGASTETPLNLSPLTSYTVTVGAGGSGGANNYQGAAGYNSVFDSITSLGGGLGAGYSIVGGGAGGSGGGGSGSLGSSISGGAGTSGQGFSGENGVGQYGGGGGGGAGESGGTDGPQYGGDGLVSTIITSAQATSLSVGEVIGSDVYYAGGGGGGGAQTTSPSIPGGDGGGGNGNVSGNGAANTGGGGGGSAGNGPTAGSGGSGVVILRYANTLTPTVSAGLTSTTTTVGSDKVTVFTAGTGTVSWS